MKSDSVIYMIESDPALSLVKRHIAEYERVLAEAEALADEYGASSWSISRLDGRLTSMGFDGKSHPQFTQPRKGRCHPKRGTEAAAKFAAIKGFEIPADTISRELGVPLALSWKHPDDGCGWASLKSRYSACGWLYLSEDGPYALWIPNVQAAIEHLQQQGKTVDPPVFDMHLPGCRRTVHEEWDFLVAQQNWKEALSAAQQSSAQEAQP